MKWTDNHIWVLDTPIVTKQPHFTYKYVLMENEKIIKRECGLNRIADLEILPDLT